MGGQVTGGGGNAGDGGTATLGSDFSNTVLVTIPAGTYDGTSATAVATGGVADG